jgi:hypothetical protein
VPGSRWQSVAVAGPAGVVEVLWAKTQADVPRVRYRWPDGATRVETRLIFLWRFAPTET